MEEVFVDEVGSGLGGMEAEVVECLSRPRGGVGVVGCCGAGRGQGSLDTNGVLWLSFSLEEGVEAGAFGFVGGGSENGVGGSLLTQGLLSATKLLESDDDAIFKKVQETHKPQGRQVDNIDGLFSIIGKILLHDNPKSDHDVPNEKSVVHEVPASLINKICCKLACNCTDRDAEETTMTILEKELQNYLWDEKLVIVAAAFAVNYGEFYLLTQLDTPDPVAKNMAFLKQLQFIKEIGSASQNLSGAINELIHAIMTVIKCVLLFSVLDPKYFEAEEQPSAPTEIARATYWTIYSVVTCGSYIAKLVGLRNQNTMAEMTSRLKTLASKVSSMQKVLQVKFSHRKHQIETYKWLINRFNTYQDHTILSDLFDVEGGKTALVVGHDNKKEVRNLPNFNSDTSQHLTC
ncbi:protein SIEVE ELEMENT OCCLUSION B-like [Hevea brasiliensis]|uniref:protein SIEVE ELEMENT OCCLUSION B-like n=1 Tax=Hevea brasiliensis TaxID=3981 RepID=UPI0025EE6324|nr:protein SIEVE ELEMENT OCCLUSION B-like [Hevea brasiliensis]